MHTTETGHGSSEWYPLIDKLTKLVSTERSDRHTNNNIHVNIIDGNSKLPDTGWKFDVAFISTLHHFLSIIVL